MTTQQRIRLTVVFLCYPIVIWYRARDRDPFCRIVGGRREDPFRGFVLLGWILALLFIAMIWLLPGE